MGVTANSLNGAERLQIMNRSFNPDGREKFKFSWDLLPQSGLSVKDFIAPSSFDFTKGNSFKMSGKYGAVSFIQILASEMSDRMLAAVGSGIAVLACCTAKSKKAKKTVAAVPINDSWNCK